MADARFQDRREALRLCHRTERHRGKYTFCRRSLPIRTDSGDRRHISAFKGARTLMLWKCLSNPELPSQGESAPKVMQEGRGMGSVEI
jgi:hypothetical protein